MGIMVYSLLWVMQDLYHQPFRARVDCVGGLGMLGEALLVAGWFRMLRPYGNSSALQSKSL